jgi:HAD superfamily hydrolase (TIGR01484 family)
MMPVSLVVTDLDGTLLDSERRLRPAERATLDALGAAGVLRVVATGRSLYSARRVLDAHFPIDYLVHTSGAGIVSWPDARVVNVLHMDAPLAAHLAAQLVELELDFMLQRAIPPNQSFQLHRASRDNTDFERRIELYAEHASDLDLRRLGTEPMCQAVVIEPAAAPNRHPELVARFAELSVIRATSPLDHRSRWYEIFPRGVAKSLASALLRERGLCGAGLCVAVGNDYNDLDLLEWADLPFVVANAPAELLQRFPSVASNDDGGFSEAVRRAFAAGHAP